MTEADAILLRMATALSESKLIAGPLAWYPGNRPRKLVLAALAEGISINAELHITAVSGLPDENVTFQLCLAEPAGTYPISRFDWKPPGIHTNKLGPHKGIRSETGLHPFAENAALGFACMVSDNLPVCLPVTPEPSDFGEAVAYVCATFNLAFVNGLPFPPWSPTLML
ncbi:hypothetical protein G3T14_15740 [Methylobacterium sp. BTF04]|uniref:hypothetical protein n=1 Tax=Methylobacterium sp. BTF04 TaxID=2708300 RepID=UPI0013D1E4AA|nr:hypothetical protein [Methylobacterium sp. BTF04]NEU13572.1 hypothetical protein [Methylobacterium sp. BTF04]